jgi:hypothetical protein
MKRKILPIILMFSALFTQAQENGGGGFDPPGEPCPPMTETVPFCFTNSDESLDCPKQVCMTFTAKPEKAAQLQNCLFNPQDYCTTLQPGESGCINIPVPSLPITEWYDLSITVRSIPTGVTPVFVLEPFFLNPDGSGNEQSITESGGCAPGYHTNLSSDDGYNFIILGVTIPTTGP